MIACYAVTADLLYYVNSPRKLGEKNKEKERRIWKMAKLSIIVNKWAKTDEFEGNPHHTPL